MGIEDINISEELETNAPSIKYSGNEGPKSPQEMQQKAEYDMQEYIIEFENVFPEMKELRGTDEYMNMLEDYFRSLAKGPILPSPEDPVNPFGPKPQGPVLPNRQMAAYGGIMGLDGRKQYGIGSWFQENIMDPIKNNPVLAATAAYLGYDTYKNTGERGDFEDSILGKGIGVITDERTRKNSKGEDETYTIGGDVAGLIGKNIVPIVGGIGAGLFTKGGGQDASTMGTPNDQTGIDLAEYKKAVNLLDQKQAMAANFNFAPTVASRKYSPTEMIDVYQNAANGGRIGFNMGGGADMGAPQMNRAQVTEEAITKIMQKMQDPNLTDEDRAFLQAQLQNFMPQQQMPMMGMEQMPMMAMGGRINRAEGGIMDLGGMEKDYRAEGGFVPIGREEKADDVPARLSVNEFVFTADAVRNAGGGDIDQGAKVMENMMKHLEAGGQVSEESQGMGGAREMFETSERLSEVI